MPKQMYASACILCGQVYTGEDPDEVQKRTDECENLRSFDQKWKENQEIHDNPIVKVKEIRWIRTSLVETHESVHMPMYVITIEDGEHSPPLSANSIEFVLSALKK